MKKNKSYRFSEISSFEDFQIEKDRLILKRKLIEIKLNYDFLLISNVFSASNLIFTFAKEYILPKISGFFKSDKKEADPDVTA
jgi:hypothetical protein